MSGSTEYGALSLCMDNDERQMKSNIVTFRFCVPVASVPTCEGMMIMKVCSGAGPVKEWIARRPNNTVSSFRI